MPLLHLDSQMNEYMHETNELDRELIVLLVLSIESLQLICTQESAIGAHLFQPGVVRHCSASKLCTTVQPSVQDAQQVTEVYKPCMQSPSSLFPTGLDLKMFRIFRCLHAGHQMYRRADVMFLIIVIIPSDSF